MAFLGFASPNYTQAPNEFYDVLLPLISTIGELKVTEVVIRQTMGFHRRGARMSLSDFEKGTGLSRPAVIAGLRAAVERGTIKRDKHTQRIILNIKAGSKAALLADSKRRLPAPVKKNYQNGRSNHRRAPQITGHLAHAHKPK